MKRVGILHGGVEIRQEEPTPTDEEVAPPLVTCPSQAQARQPPGCRLRIVEF